MENGKYVIYGRPGSGSDIVQMLLEEIGAAYTVSRVGREPADIAAYQRLAGTTRVPALALPEGGTMFESAAICIHLAAAHPRARLAPPPASADHARFLQWMTYLAVNLYECARRIYYPERYGGQSGAEAVRQLALADFPELLGPLIPSLQPYVLGPGICAVDFYLHVVAGWLPEGREPLLQRWPAMAAHARLMASRPSVRKVEAQET